MATKVIPMSEVKKHKKQKSVWMVINNEVYDVTKFMDEHPGGADALLDSAGKDATVAFEDIGHSSDARELMKKFRIGTLPSNERNVTLEPCCKTTVTSKPSYPAVIIKKSGSSMRSRGTKSCQFSDSCSTTPRASRSRTRSVSPRFSPHVHTIIVPRESNKWKWILLALGVAIIAGVAYKKFSSA